MSLRASPTWRLLYVKQGLYVHWPEPLYERALAIREKSHWGPSDPDDGYKPQQPGMHFMTIKACMRKAEPLYERVSGHPAKKHAGARAPRCGSEPEQPGTALRSIKAGMRRPSRCMNERWLSGKKHWGQSTPMWP